MGTRLYFVRHGETQWNAVKKFQGHSDITLSPVGREQAERLAQYMQKFDINAAYASDLSRAKETAEIIAGKFNIPVICKQQLREINFGNWEGLTIEEITDRYKETVEQWWKNPSATPIPGGEVLSDLVKRVMAAISDIIAEHPGQNVLVVSHGGVIRSIICHIMGIDLNEYWRLQMNNCSLSILYFPDGEIKKGILELFNFSY
ncbi:alpha-ribazole phosphatase/probable phosphoglycerate mutase [Desulfohalotomaculum tongense]|uniref:alpha-ribazole phosphatase n=1 Tax=Desulforadius tongensis TaxID=1216062 RepID=UPI00195A49D0|nr:alpha-ribazole phosphatase [Desulforadius tongensis]MBM7854487.1 alpha-ribazole phosphatase/probable phosphoglycerate mutase [Desulforadius tongensis]